MLSFLFLAFMILSKVVLGLLLFYGVFKIMIYFSRPTHSSGTSDSTGSDFENSHSSGSSSSDFCSGDSGSDGGGCD